MAEVYFLLGGNLGDRIVFLQKSQQLLRQEFGQPVLVSSIYETEPWGFDHEQSFLNQVIVCKTNLKPLEVLNKAQAIEEQLGRVRKKNRYSERTIDIDILFYDRLVIETDRLQIPHPRIRERMFVLAPLLEIAPEFVHPVIKKSVKELKKECLDESRVSIFSNKSEC